MAHERPVEAKSESYDDTYDDYYNYSYGKSYDDWYNDYYNDYYNHSCIDYYNDYNIDGYIDGGYIVCYNHGTDKEYWSFSPKDVFESGYDEIGNADLKRAAKHA